MDTQQERLQELIEELASNYRELASLLVAEAKARNEGFWHNDENSVSGRDRIADNASIDLTTEVIQLKGEIKALECERDYLYFTLGNYVNITVGI